MGKLFLFIIAAFACLQLSSLTAKAAGGNPALVVNGANNPNPNAECPQMNQAKAVCDTAFEEMQKKAKDKDEKIDSATEQLSAAGNSIAGGPAAMCAASAQLSMRYKDIGDKLASYAETLKKAGDSTKKACDSAVSTISGLTLCAQKNALLSAVKEHISEANKKIEKSEQAKKGSGEAYKLAASSQASCNNTDTSGAAQAASAGGGIDAPGGCAQNTSCERDQWDGWNPRTSKVDMSTLSYDGPVSGTAGSNNAALGNWETTTTLASAPTPTASPYSAPTGGSMGSSSPMTGAAPAMAATPTQALTTAAAQTAGGVAAQQLSATSSPTTGAASSVPLSVASDPAALARTGTTGELGYYAPESKTKSKEKSKEDEDAPSVAAKASSAVVRSGEPEAASPAMVSIALSPRGPTSAKGESDEKLARAEKLKKLDATQGAGAKAAVAGSSGFASGYSGGAGFASRIRSSFSSWLSGGKSTTDVGGGGVAVSPAAGDVDLARFLPNMSNGGRTAGVTETGLRASGLHSAGTDFFQKIQHRYRSLDGSFLKENGL